MKKFSKLFLRKHGKSAFTLIELLVVISIISLLSSIVATSLQSARQNARLSSIKSAMNNSIRAAEIYFYENSRNSYDAFCSSTIAQDVIANINSNGGKAACYVSLYTGTDYRVELKSVDWAISALFNNRYYTVNSTSGVKVFDTANLSTTNWTNANTACRNQRKLLASPSQLRTLYLVGTTAGTNRTPTGFSNSSTGYWSYLSSPSLATHAYYTSLNNGTPQRQTKTGNRMVRCIS